MIEKPIFRYLITPVIGAVVFFVVIGQLRLLGGVFFLIAVLVYAFQGAHKRFSVALWLLGVAVGLSFVPIDVTLRNCDGPPRLVRVVYGYPADSTIPDKHGACEIDWRGDVIVSIFPPRWALVW